MAAGELKMVLEKLSKGASTISLNYIFFQRNAINFLENLESLLQEPEDFGEQLGPVRGYKKVTGIYVHQTFPGRPIGHVFAIIPDGYSGPGSYWQETDRDGPRLMSPVLEPERLVPYGHLQPDFQAVVGPFLHSTTAYGWINMYGIASRDSQTMYVFNHDSQTSLIHSPLQ